MEGGESEAVGVVMRELVTELHFILSEENGHVGGL